MSHHWISESRACTTKQNQTNSRIKQNPFFQDNSKNINVKIVKDNEALADDLIQSKNFRGRNILGEDFLAISSTPNYVNRRKCYAIGFTILELSKFQMYCAW